MVPEGNQSTSGDDEIDDEYEVAVSNSDAAQGGSGLESRFERRSVLKLLGVSAIPFLAGTASASETNGYGTGEYGIGAYGGETGSETENATDSESDDTDTSETSLENTIRFDGIGTSGVSEYEFTVTGTVEKSRDGGASINDEDTIDGDRVTGSLTGWRDAFRFSGDLETLTVTGQARVYVNGNRVDPADYGGEQSKVVTIVGNGTYSEYQLTTDGSVEVTDGDDVTVVSEGRAEGAIERDVHRLRLTGDLVDFTFLEGGTQVYLENQRIDPADYSGDVTLPHAIVFDGTGASGPTTYSFTVDGRVSQSEYLGATIDESDSIDGATVTGVVGVGERDAYRFDGSIVDFSSAGEADVDVEYDAPL